MSVCESVFSECVHKDRLTHAHTYIHIKHTHIHIQLYKEQILGSNWKFPTYKQQDIIQMRINVGHNI